MTPLTLPIRFAKDRQGSAIVEFALLAPVMLTMMLGVFYVAISMQNYNALRSVVSDGVREVMVQYQRGSRLNTDTIESVILSKATGRAYLLDSDRIDVDVSSVDDSRVDGALEFDITVTYTLEDWLPFVDLEETTLTYSRPVFVVAPAP